MSNNLSELERYAIGFAEIHELFKYADEEFLDKIPNKFKNFISEHRDLNHVFKFDVNKPLQEQELTEAAKEIISIIYFNCFCTKEEREKILEEEKLRKAEQEEVLRNKYNPDNIFKKVNEDIVEHKEEASTHEQRYLLDTRNLTWYKKIYFKILDFVSRFRRSLS